MAINRVSRCILSQITKGENGVCQGSRPFSDNDKRARGNHFLSVCNVWFLFSVKAARGGPARDGPGGLVSWIFFFLEKFKNIYVFLC